MLSLAERRAATQEPTKRKGDDSDLGLASRRDSGLAATRLEPAWVLHRRGRGPKTPECEGEVTQGPWRRGATRCCKLSRQLQACDGRDRLEHLLPLFLGGPSWTYVHHLALEARHRHRLVPFTFCQGFRYCSLWCHYAWRHRFGSAVSRALEVGPLRFLTPSGCMHDCATSK